MSDRDARIVFAYGNGDDLRTVAHAHKLSHEGVRKVLRRHGIQPRRVGRPRVCSTPAST